jgi:hypothetical protein
MPSEPTPDESGLPREAYVLLSQANLLRMRGCWEEAVQNCMTALRLAPDSSSAQSLLGDIYENQGRFDDAVQWYRMALDANPDSPADQIKLDRLLQRQSPHLTRRFPVTETIAPPRSASFSLLQAWRDSPETALRYTSLIAAILVLAVVVFAYAAAHHQAALLSLGLTTPEVQAKPVLVAPVAIPPAFTATAVTWRDSSEQALLETLKTSPDLSAQGITINDIQTDPRTQQIMVTLALSPIPTVSRTAVLRSSLHTVEAAAALSPTASAFTVRCLLLPKDGAAAGSGTLLFVGDIARSALPAVAPEPSDDQIPALFTDLWWSPQIAG